MDFLTTDEKRKRSKRNGAAFLGLFLGWNWVAIFLYRALC